MKKNKPEKIPYPVTLATKRLRICSAKPGDGPALNRAIKESFPELSRWLPWATRIPSVEETENYARDTTAKFIQRQDYCFRIHLSGKRAPIGCVGLHPRDPAVPSYEIGYWLHSAHTGNGYMTEAVQALAIWARDVAGARRILIRAQTKNRASWSIPKRLGFKFEGIHRNQIRDNAGKLADMRIYAAVFKD